MATRFSTQTLLLAFVWAFAATSLLLFAMRRTRPTPAPPLARSTPGSPEPAPAPTPQETGRRLFRESAAWVARGETPEPAVKSFHLALDAKFDLDGTHTDGPMSLWMQAPNLYRQQRVMGGVRDTRVMNADGVWSARPGSSSLFTRETDEGQLGQVRDDYERLRDLAVLMTLRGLDGPGVSFEFEGEKKPSGSFARGGGATWLKVARKAPGRPDITFWFAHEPDGDGVPHATYPGVVRIAGEPQNYVATEDYIFSRWEDAPTDPPRAFRFPRTIRALQRRPGEGPYEFLRAAVMNIAIDAGIDPTVFTPTQAWIDRPAR